MYQDIFDSSFIALAGDKDTPGWQARYFGQRIPGRVTGVQWFAVEPVHAGGSRMPLNNVRHELPL